MHFAESTHARVEQKYLIVPSRDSYAASLALLEQEMARLPDSYKSTAPIRCHARSIACSYGTDTPTGLSLSSHVLLPDRTRNRDLRQRVREAEARTVLDGAVVSAPHRRTALLCQQTLTLASFGCLLRRRMTQPQRTRSVDAFKNAKKGILFTSDVTARGIDVPNVRLIPSRQTRSAQTTDA